MYKLDYFEQDPDHHLRRNGESIEMVYTTDDEAENVSFFCKDTKGSILMGDVVKIKGDDGVFIHHMSDGVVKRTEISEWADKCIPSHILDSIHLEFGKRYECNAMKGPLYTLLGNGLGRDCLMIQTDLYSFKTYLGDCFSINADTGIVMVIDSDGTQRLNVFEVTNSSVNLILTDEINDIDLKPDAQCMKVSKYDSEECWKIRCVSKCEPTNKAVNGFYDSITGEVEFFA